MQDSTLVLTAAWLGRVSGQATVVAGVVLLMQWLFRNRLSPGVRSGLWFLLVARLVLPFSAPSPWSLFNLAPSARKAAGPVPVPWPARAGQSEARDTSRADLTMPVEAPSAAWHSAPGLRASGVLNQSLAEPAHSAGDRAREIGPAPGASGVAERLAWPLAWIWLTGVVFLSFRVLWQNGRFALRLRRDGQVPDRASLRLLGTCTRLIGLRAVPPLIESQSVQSPALYGLWRPCLILPRGMAQDYSATELRFIFLHELGHLKRRDMAVNWLMAGLQILHWFNPALWFAFGRMRADRELACDALALSRAGAGENRAYGETILRVVSDLSRPAGVPGLVGMAEDMGQLKTRLRMIAQFRKRSTRPLIPGLLFAVMAVATLTDAQTAKQVAAPRPAPAASAPALSTRTNLIHTSPGREAILQALEKIVPEILYDGLALSEVVRNLNEQSRLLDPRQHGINFIINPRANSLPHPGKSEGIDPTTGQPLGAPLPEKPVNLNEVAIRLHLYDVRLVEVIDAICRVAETPLEYSVQDYAVVFTQRSNEPPQLFTRTFRVDPNTFLEGINSLPVQLGANDLPAREIGGVGDHGPASGGGIGSSGITYSTKPSSTMEQLRNFLASAGVDFSKNATMAGATGLPYPAGKALFFNERTGLILVRATMAELDTVEKAIQVLNTTPPQLAIEAKLLELTPADIRSLGFDWFLGNIPGSAAAAQTGEAGANPSAQPGVFPGALGADQPAATGIPPAARAATGVLTDPQLRTVLRAIEQRGTGKIVASPTVTTLSGRKIRTEIPSAGFSLEMLPRVLADGFSVQLDVDFALGAADSEQSTNAPDPKGPEKSGGPLRLSTRAIVWDGQTMVFGPFPNGDSRAGRRVILLITPTTVDPAGNRVHTAAGIPFSP